MQLYIEITGNFVYTFLIKEMELRDETESTIRLKKYIEQWMLSFMSLEVNEFNRLVVFERIMIYGIKGLVG